MAVIDSNGKQVIKTESDYLHGNYTGGLAVASKSEFSAAGGGSIILASTETIAYTAKGMREVKSCRNENTPINRPYDANIMSSVYEDDIKRSKKYMDSLAKKLQSMEGSREL